MSTVTLLISSEADGRFFRYDVNLQGITLTNAAGKTVTLMSSSQQQYLEFIHVNGKIEPRLTVSIPQDTYTSASVNVASGGPSCAYIDSGGTTELDFRDDGAQPGSVTVTLPAPLAVTSAGVGLVLTLLGGQSGADPACGTQAEGASATSTMAFTLSAFAITGTASGPQDGLVEALQGQVLKRHLPDSYQIALPSYLSDSSGLLTVTEGAGTVLEGAEALDDGSQEFVEVDGALQPDGSLLAKRLVAPDATAVDAQSGPIDQVGDNSVFEMFQNLQQGKDLTISTWQYQSSASSTFATWVQPDASLPFTPAFTAANVVTGQNVYVTSPAYVTVSTSVTAANTVTLLPQTIDAQISAVATSGSYTVYTATLASYDPIVLLSGISPNVVAQPATVTIYVSGSTQMLNSSAPAAGSTLRFYGLLFNDGGALRMDCTRIMDGVEFMSATAQGG